MLFSFTYILTSGTNPSELFQGHLNFVLKPYSYDSGECPSHLLPTSIQKEAAGQDSNPTRSHKLN